ncbi:hypothetical protein RQP46_006621 [Phenoliferia psychrophenolica]
MSPQPRLLVLAGSSLSSLSPVAVNSEPHDVSSSLFKGAVSVRLDGYLGKDAVAPSSPTTAFHDGATFSIVIRGRFKEEIKAAEVLWGNEWDKPIRDSLPYGTTAALKFVGLVDPTLTHDLYADKPWALSPLLSTVNYLSLTHLKPDEPLPPFDDVVPEDISALANDAAELVGHPDKRKKWLADKKGYEGVVLGPDVFLASDFCNGYIDFSTLSLKLPGGLHFSLQNIWDGQPVRFVCRTQDGNKSFFFVTFQIVEEGGEEVAKEKVDEVVDSANEDTLGVD